VGLDRGGRFLELGDHQENDVCRRCPGRDGTANNNPIVDDAEGRQPWRGCPGSLPRGRGGLARCPPWSMGARLLRGSEMYLEPLRAVGVAASRLNALVLRQQTAVCSGQRRSGARPGDRPVAPQVPATTWDVYHYLPAHNRWPYVYPGIIGDLGGAAPRRGHRPVGVACDRPRSRRPVVEPRVAPL